MGRRCAYWIGVGLIAVAIVAVPSLPIVSSYVGGSAVRGHVEDGRYLVNPEHGRPIVEVSESTWRVVYWLERLWPFSAWVPGLAGLFLTGYGKGPNPKPTPAPPPEPPPWFLWTCLASAGITIAGTWMCWVVSRTPWVTMLVAWVLICASTGTLAWLYSRSLRQQSKAETVSAPDPAHK